MGADFWKAGSSGPYGGPRGEVFFGKALRRWEKGLGKVLVGLGLLFLCVIPTPVIKISHHDGTPWIGQKVLPGQEVITVYTHSVERTEVRDTYRVVGGVLWAWETWTKSHNAGLPTETGMWGRYFLQGPWQVYQGCHASYRRIVWRVGNEILGRNIVMIPPGEEVKAFLLFLGVWMVVTVSWGWGPF